MFFNDKISFQPDVVLVKCKVKETHMVRQERISTEGKSKSV